MAKINKYEIHDFYCINCGAKSIPLARPRAKQKDKFHRKLLYCYQCGHTVNHVECRNDIERQQFYADFMSGKFKQEAEEELRFEQEHPSIEMCLKGKK